MRCADGMRNRRRKFESYMKMVMKDSVTWKETANE